MHSDEMKNAEELGHEPMGVSALSVTKGFAALFGLIIASLLLVGAIVFLFTNVDGGPATVDGSDKSMAVPPGVPQLNANQRGSLRELRARETRVLTEYEWVDSEAGIARIPIKRAMEILGEAGTPKAAPTNDDPAN